MPEKFFDEQTEQSEVKAALVAKYFPAYMRVIGSAQRTYGGDRIAYIDLFAGPGRYKDGAQSTPVKIIEQAIADPDMRQRLVANFNDKDEGNVKSLQQTLEALPGYGKLKHRPQIHHGEVEDEIVKEFEEKKLVPTLFFVDPWGYKGMTLRLINSVLKDWAATAVSSSITRASTRDWPTMPSSGTWTRYSDQTGQIRSGRDFRTRP